MKINPLIIYFFLAASIAIAIFADYIHQSYVKGSQSYDHISQTNLVIKHIERVSSSVLQMESDYRGYVITGSSSFRDSFSRATHQIKQELDMLSSLTSANIIQKKNTDTLFRLVDEKVLLGRTLIHVRDSSANTVLAEYTQHGVLLMDSIRQRLGLMLQEEGHLLKLRVAKYDKAQRNSYLTELYGRICAFIFLILFLLRLNKDINLREKAESEAKSSENKYKRLIEDAHVVMFTSDIDGVFTFISERVKTLTGYTKEELLGKSFADIVKPDWIEKVRERYQVQMKQRIPESSLEFPIVNKERDVRWVEQLGVLRYDEAGNLTGMQCIVKDITDQKLTQLELENSELKRKEYQQRLQSILDNSTSLVFMKDRQGRYLFINKKFESVMRVTIESLRGKTDFDLHEKEAAQRYSDVDTWVLENKAPKEVQEIISQPDGDHHYMIVKFPLYNIYHEVEGICGIASDITTRVKYEQQLIEARKIAEKAEKFQEQFLANMSHDIRTPLNGIAGMTGLLSETTLDSEQKEYIDAIRQSSNTLMVLVNDILDLSKIKAGKLNVESIPFDLRGLITGSVFTLKQKAKEKGLQFFISVSEDIPVILTGDPHRLSQILINLISNSIKFTDEGEIRLLLEIRERKTDQLWIYFSVTDTGIGIGEDKLDMIFESYTQSRSDTYRKYGGTGLGLAIVKQLVLLQGGEIQVESRLGQGSNFHFVIPYFIPKEDSHDLVKPADKISEFDTQDLSNYRLLVAEDDLVNQKFVQYTLKKAGIRADVVGNGKEMIDLLQSGKKYDLILSDIHMPEMDGYEAAKHIRHVLKIDVPILAMTATVLKEEKNLCLEAGMNDYISKPFSIDELIEKIRFYVKDKERTYSLQKAELQSQAETQLYDLSYLKELDDPVYVKEMLTLVLTSVPTALQSIKSNTQEQKWQEVSSQAHKLKSPLGMLQMTSLLDVVTSIENQAKTETRLNTMQGLIERALELFAAAQSSIEAAGEKL